MSETPIGVAVLGLGNVGSEVVRIIEESAVAFPRPRTIAMSYDPDFVTLTQRLRELIMNARPGKETVQ